MFTIHSALDTMFPFLRTQLLTTSYTDDGLCVYHTDHPVELGLYAQAGTIQ